MKKATLSHSLNKLKHHLNSRNPSHSLPSEPGPSTIRRTAKPPTTYQRGFTIVELLVVIVVIGILAAITIVSYSGISQKATVVSLISDLDNASKQLKLYQVEYSSFPTTLTSNCPTAPINDTKYCLKPSSGNTYTYSSLGVATSPQSFALQTTNNTTKYIITVSYTHLTLPTIAITDPANWLAIG